VCVCVLIHAQIFVAVPIKIFNFTCSFPKDLTLTEMCQKSYADNKLCCHVFYVPAKLLALIFNVVNHLVRITLRIFLKMELIVPFCICKNR
jgi:hypothetical protein